MESEIVNIIRESQRNLLTISRRDHRHEEQDKSRLRLSSPQEVEAIAHRLCGKTISVLDLVVLRNRLADNAAVVNIVLNVKGAVRGLIRELSGTHPEKQVSACACVCNMCAVSTEASILCAQHAAAYLHTALDSHNLDLVVTSAWCLGNMCAGGVGQCEIMTSLGCHYKLLAMAISGDNEDARVAAMYACVHYVYVGRDQISEDYFMECLKTMQPMDVTSLSLQFMFYLSCHQLFTQINNEFNIVCFVKKLLTYLDWHKSNLGNIQNECIYSMRILANMLCCPQLNCLLICESIDKCDALQTLLADECNVSAQWLLANINAFNSNEVTRMT